MSRSSLGSWAISKSNNYSRRSNKTRRRSLQPSKHVPYSVLCVWISSNHRQKSMSPSRGRSSVKTKWCRFCNFRSDRARLWTSSGHWLIRRATHLYQSRKGAQSLLLVTQRSRAANFGNIHNRNVLATLQRCRTLQRVPLNEVNYLQVVSQRAKHQLRSKKNHLHLLKNALSWLGYWRSST